MHEWLVLFLQENFINFSIFLIAEASDPNDMNALLLKEAGKQGETCPLN